MLEDLPDDGGIVQGGDQAQPALTLGTRQHVDAAQVQARGVQFTPASPGPAARSAIEVVGSGANLPYTTTRPATGRAGSTRHGR